MKKAVLVLLGVLLGWSVPASANLGHWPIEDRLASGLAGMRCPDLSGSNPDQVVKEVYELFDGFKMKEEKFKELKEKVSDHSVGRVSLTKGDPEKFKIGIRGPAEYLILLRDGKTEKRIIIGPYYPPCTIDEGQ